MKFIHWLLGKTFGRCDECGVLLIAMNSYSRTATGPAYCTIRCLNIAEFVKRQERGY